MRLRALLCCALIALGVLALPASASGCSTARAQRGRNPTYAQVNTAIDQAANRRRVPPSLLKAIAWRESGWAQFWPDGRAKVSGDCGIGIMQITGGHWDYARLGRDYLYNVDAGAQVLAGKMAASSANVPPALGRDDIRVFENWYRATYRYNGAGYSAERYADSVFAMVVTPPSAIAPYSPSVRVTNPKHVIPGYRPTSGHAYVAGIDGTWRSTAGTYRRAVQRADYLAHSARMAAGSALEGDQQRWAVFLVRNLGYATWTPSTVPLQTYPAGRRSLLQSGSWPGVTTPTRLTTNVGTGGVARYQFRAQAARVATSRTVDEFFAPTISGVPIAMSSAASRWTLHPAKAPTAAIVSAPEYVTDAALDATAVLRLSASDPAPGSGVRRIELVRRQVCDGCAFSGVTTVASTVRLAFEQSGAHEVMVRAIDNAGHASPWSAVSTIVVPRDNGSVDVVADALWSTTHDDNSWLGTVHEAAAGGAALQTSGTGTRLAVIGTRGPDAAALAVHVDGVLVAVVEPFADAYSQRAVLWEASVPAGEHLLRVEVVGESSDSGPDAPGQLVARIDALALA